MGSVKQSPHPGEHGGTRNEAKARPYASAASWCTYSVIAISGEPAARSSRDSRVIEKVLRCVPRGDYHRARALCRSLLRICLARLLAAKTEFKTIASKITQHPAVTIARIKLRRRVIAPFIQTGLRGRGRRWTQAATPDHAGTLGRLRGAHRPIRHDCEDDRILSTTRNETRSLNLMSALRVNSGTVKQKDRPKAYHRYRASLRRPQWCSFRSGLKTLSTFRLSALTMPMRANMVGPPRVATRPSASMAACHSGTVCSDAGSLRM